MNSVKKEVKVGKKEQKHITGLIVNEDSNGKEISISFFFIKNSLMSFHGELEKIKNKNEETTLSHVNVLSTSFGFLLSIWCHCQCNNRPFTSTCVTQLAKGQTHGYLMLAHNATINGFWTRF